jgi:hypothetical protein
MHALQALPGTYAENKLGRDESLPRTQHACIQLLQHASTNIPAKQMIQKNQL